MNETTTTWASTVGRWTGTAMRGLIWFEAQIDWAEVGEIVVRGVVTLVVMTFLAGRGLGRWMHRTNDRLAAAWVRIWVKVPATPARSAAPVLAAPLLLPPARIAGLLAPAPVLEPAGPTAEALMALTVRQLMELTGTRRKLSKARLVEIAMA